MSTENCFLCALELPRNPVREENHCFCCSGCKVVYQILSSQEIEGEYQAHPLFHQALRSKVISNPKLLEEIEQKKVEEQTQTLRCEVTQMWCPSCTEVIRLILMRQKGVKQCFVDYSTDIAVIEYAPRYISQEQLFQLIKRMGYHPHPLFSKESQKISRKLWIRFSIATFCTLNLMMFAIPLYSLSFSLKVEGYETLLGWLSLLLSLPLLLYCAWPVWQRLWTGVRTSILGMETLVFVGVSSAFAYSTFHLLHKEPTYLYYDSMGMVITCVLLGKILESKVKFSAKESLYSLARSSPKKGCKRFSSGKWIDVPLQEIKVGDQIRARMGEKIVLDGRVEKGEGLVDESVITGEAIPNRKKEGSLVVSGTLVRQGTIYYKVTKDKEHCFFSKILHMVESDLLQKQHIHRLIDKISIGFVPVVLFMSLLAWWIGDGLRAISVLLISCPCAIGIATPLAESFLLKCFIQKGALVRNRKVFSRLAKKIFFVFDKTGTLTVGRFQVYQGVEVLSSYQQSLLKSLVSSSTHPISVAIHEAITAPYIKLDDLQEIMSKGVEGFYQKRRYILGSKSFLQERGVELEEPVTNDFESLVYFAEEKTLLSCIHLSDSFREKIPQVNGVILSGDHPLLVSRIAKKYGFKWGKGGCDPLQKRKEIEKLKAEGNTVVMVGDGVNDAPALTTADVSICMASAADISKEVSDIWLTQNTLERLPLFSFLAQQGQKVITQNLFWAFFYNTLGLALALSGMLRPLFSAFAMILSSLFVILNSMRLKSVP